MLKRNAKIFGKFYSPEEVLSYNRPWNFILASRSVGKSTAFACWLIIQYLKYGKKFIYLRRTEKEVQSTCKTFFKSCIPILNRNGYKVAEFKFDRGAYYVKRVGSEEFEQCGLIMDLKHEQQYKSGNYSDYWHLIYDEFIARDKTLYLGRQGSYAEYDALLSLYQTIDRGIDHPFRNETRFFMLGNNSSYYNPIFVKLGIDELINSSIRILAPKDKMWIVEQLDEVEATKEIKNSWAYQLSDETNRKYAYENNNAGFDKIKEGFVDKINKPKKPICNIALNGNVYGVFYIEQDDLVYISRKKTTIHGAYSLTNEDHKVNYTLAHSYKSKPALKTLFECYTRGDVRFETNKIYFEIRDYFKLV